MRRRRKRRRRRRRRRGSPGASAPTKRRFLMFCRRRRRRRRQHWCANSKKFAGWGAKLCRPKRASGRERERYLSKASGKAAAREWRAKLPLGYNAEIASRTLARAGTMTRKIYSIRRPASKRRESCESSGEQIFVANTISTNNNNNNNSNGNNLGVFFDGR